MNPNCSDSGSSPKHAACDWGSPECERSDTFAEEPSCCDIGGVVHSGVDPGESDRGCESVEWDSQTWICRARNAGELTRQPMQRGPRASRTKSVSADFAPRAPDR
jgi:hypothetical protein